MDRVIEELKSVPNVMGCYVFNSKAGIVANNLPPVFKTTKLTDMGKMLVSMYNTGRVNFSDISEICLCYQESAIIVRESSGNNFLIAICDSSVNFNLLTMSVNLVMKELSDLDEDDVDFIEAEEIPGTNRAMTAEELLKSGPMAESLNGMRTSLAKVMGPIARIIFVDALNEWLNSNKPSFSTMSNLIDILCREINNPEKVRYFIKLIIPYVEPGKK